MIVVPLANGGMTGHVLRTLNVRLGRDQAMALKRLRLGLENAGETLKDGTEVTDNSKVVRWLLEQVEKAE